MSDGLKDLKMVIVTETKKSPMNDRVWLVKLECGHERWMSGIRAPKRAYCHICDDLDKVEKGAAIRRQYRGIRKAISEDK